MRDVDHYFLLDAPDVPAEEQKHIAQRFISIAMPGTIVVVRDGVFYTRYVKDDEGTMHIHLELEPPQELKCMEVDPKRLENSVRPFPHGIACSPHRPGATT